MTTVPAGPESPNGPGSPNGTAIVAVVGSLRAGSVNRIVFERAVELMPADSSLVESPVADLPLYNGDVEEAGDPAEVVALRSDVEAADGLIFFTPEYNRSMPAVTKNAIDWLSRLPGDSALSRSVVGAVATTRGRHEATGVRAHLTDSLGGISGRYFTTTLGIGSAGQHIDDGRLTDEEAVASLKAWLAAFVDFVREPAA